MKLITENFYSWCFMYVLGSLPYEYMRNEGQM